MKYLEVKRRFVLDEFGTHIPVSRSVCPQIVHKLADEEITFSVEYLPSSDLAWINVPPDGHTEILAQAVHNAETGAAAKLDQEIEEQERD